jgi:hypothetical protein
LPVLRGAGNPTCRTVAGSRCLIDRSANWGTFSIGPICRGGETRGRDAALDRGCRRARSLRLRGAKRDLPAATRGREQRSGPVLSGPAPFGEFVANQVKLVQQGIAQSLKDPASAIFGSSYRAGIDRDARSRSAVSSTARGSWGCSPSLRAGPPSSCPSRLRRARRSRTLSGSTAEQMGFTCRSDGHRLRVSHALSWRRETAGEFCATSLNIASSSVASIPSASITILVTESDRISATV